LIEAVHDSYKISKREKTGAKKENPGAIFRLLQRLFFKAALFFGGSEMEIIT
jgi:hypothetical protein